MKIKNLSWIAALYFSQGMPYALLSLVTAIFYKNLGISNAKIAFFTSLILLPWSLKPFWAPLLEMQLTKKQWLVRFLAAEAFILLLIVFLVPYPHTFYLSIVIFLALAFCGASYDIVCDGYYMVQLPFSEQSMYVGARTWFYQLARLAIQGLMVFGVGYFAIRLNLVTAWQGGFLILAIITLLLAVVNKKILNEPEDNQQLSHYVNLSAIFKTFRDAIFSFIKMPQFLLVLLFIFLYNAAEAEIIKIVPLFILDNIAHGGLGLSTESVGLIYGTLGVSSLMIGALLGGIAVSRFGLKRIFLIATFLTAITNFNYYFLSVSLTQNKTTIITLICIAQFCYGLGNSAFMSFILNTILGLEYQTTCYALATSVMCLSYVVFGSFSGILQHQLHYSKFFMLVFGLGIAIFIFTAFVIARLRNI